MGVRRLVCVTVGLAIAAGPLVATLPAAPRQNGAAASDFRAKLAGRGLTLGFTYIGEVFSDIAGGLSRKSAYLDNLSLTLTFDLGKVLGWRGATLFVYGMSIQGRNPSRNIGDAQGVSNIRAYPTSKLYEAWLEQDLLGGRLSLLAGIYDLNSEFAVIESAGVFLNSSQAIDPAFARSGRNGPSIFPYTTLGVRARFTPDRRFYFQSVVLNGVAGDPAHPSGTQISLRRSNGVLVTAEAGWLFWTRGGAPLRLHRRRSVRIYEKPLQSGKLALGLWAYTARFAPIFQNPGTPNATAAGGSHGLYLIFSQTVLTDSDDPERRLVVFARLGAANPRVNRFALYTGAGLVFDAPFAGRNRDAAGVALAAVQNGDDDMRSLSAAGRRPTRTEWDIELTYQAQVSGWLSLHPDVQYVIHPNTDPAVANALAAALRVNISF
jgi:porin